MARDSTNRLLESPAVEGVIRIVDETTVGIFCTEKDRWVWKVYLRKPGQPEQTHAGREDTMEAAERAVQKVLRGGR